MIFKGTYTLCIIMNDNRVLLQRRKKPPFHGKWNAPGGKIEPQETIEEACVREVFEETGLKVVAPNLIAKVSYAKDYFSRGIFVFCAKDFMGGLCSSEEGEVAWIPISSLFNSDDEFAFGLDWLLNIARENYNIPVDIIF